MKLKKTFLPVLSGVLTSASFPSVISGYKLPDMGWLIWVALVPLVYAIRKENPRVAFIYALVAAAVWYATSLFWIYNSITTYGMINPLTTFVIVSMLVIVLSVYSAAGVWLARSVQTVWGGNLIALLPASWVAFEFCRALTPFRGFPWSNLAMSQWNSTPVIQIADMTGIYGVIFVIVWVNVYLAETVAYFTKEKVESFVPKTVMTFTMVAAVFGYGFYKINHLPSDIAANASVNVGLVQANVPQDNKWIAANAASNLDAHRNAAADISRSGVDLIVWPEAALPWILKRGALRIDPEIIGMTGFNEKSPRTLIGLVTTGDAEDYYNSAWLVDADGEISGRYDKTHLVPFGEYVPYRDILFFIRQLTSPAGNYLNGKVFAPLEFDGRRFGTLICFEDIFPEIARKEVRAGAQFLANLTNMAWFGKSSAAYQHLAQAVFRAVENRRYFVRATNTGISAVIDPSGRIVVFSALSEPAVIVAPVKLSDEMTSYTRLGDWFAAGCSVYAVFGLIMAIIVSIRRKRGSKLTGG